MNYSYYNHHQQSNFVQPYTGNNNQPYAGNNNQPYAGNNNQYWSYQQNNHYQHHHQQHHHPRNQGNNYHQNNYHRNQQNQNHSQYQRRNHKNNGNHAQNSKPHQNSTQQETCKCEPCERDFTSQSALIAHQKQHVKCEELNCNFIASSKAVKLHFIQNHEKGRFRIVLTTPEEIKKWREERKRNWPSKSNIEKKKAQVERNKTDGIVLETKEFVYQQHSGSNQRKRGNKSFGIKEKAMKRIKQEDPNNNIDSKGGVPKNGLSLLQSYDVDSSDDEAQIAPTDVKQETMQHSVDVSLIKSEVPDASTDQNTSLKEKEIDTKTQHDNEMEDGELEATDVEEEEEKVKEDLPHHIKNNVNPDEKKKQKNNRNERRRKPNQQAKQNSKKEVSLLEMLLAKEIRHERNVILQCVRYIVQNNFFNQSSEN